VAPVIDEQLPPLALQVRHWYVNEIGWVPDHVPGSAVWVAPTIGDPEIVGGWTFRGLADPWTTAVGLDTALSEPSAFVAVTRTRIRTPTSALRSRYVVPEPAGPAMGAQFEPSAAPPSVGHRSQRYANVIGVVPDQLPRLAVSVRPSMASPTMVGSVVLWGGTSDTAEPEPGSSAAVNATAAVIDRPT